MAIISIRRQDAPVKAARFPAEWEPQSGVMLTWPHAFSDWAPVLAEADQTFALIGTAISRHERLLVAAHDRDHQDHILALLRRHGADLGGIRILVAPSDDVFVRDHGPIGVETSKGLTLLDFTFNGWGGKYRASLDNALSRSLYDQGAFGTTTMETLALILEGGSVESDGAGTLLVTASCLLSPSRNPKLTRPEIEETLKRSLGVERILWLHHGYLAGDDTDGHIDTLARFCDPDTIAYCACPHVDDEHYTELKAMETELENLVTKSAKPYRLVPLPWPSAKLNADGERMPATYANFLIINGAVLVPTYDDRRDAEAQATLARCFPDREIIGIPCLTLIAQHGSLHCATMQLAQGIFS
ncbi:MAG: agmatine deiminase family protein [Acidiferrobacter sp.]